MAEQSGRPAFLGRRVPDAFDVRQIVLASGAERAIDEAEWRDAIVVVESGEIDLEALGGSRRTFECGDVLWLGGLSLRVLHNCGSGPAVLIAVSRKNGDEFSADAPS
jgi:quercetin dioxygenase-like cupin family protein